MTQTDRQTTAHVADSLVAAVDRAGAPVCVGVDPVVERIPGAQEAPDPVAALRTFTLHVLDAVAGVVPCVKLQSACFERYGAAGVGALAEVVAAARERALQVILDAKRGDIGLSARHYAAAAFAPPRGRPAPQWMTINGYLGEDGMRPFLETGHGAFALVRTSNPGGTALQAQRLADGRTVAECLAGIVAELGRERLGASGYSSLGAVVGATQREELEGLRSAMPQQIFLVPGYGAQGGTAEDVAACFHEKGRGAIVTASRSVIYAEAPHGDWRRAVRDAARRLADEVGAVAGVR